MPTTTEIEPKEVWLCVNSHTGQKPVQVKLLRQWPKLCLIEAITETRLGGRGKVLLPNETARVPSWAIHERLVANSEMRKDMKYWLIECFTTKGLVIRSYRARSMRSARGRAEKVMDVNRLGRIKECTEAEYLRVQKINPTSR